MICLTFSQFLAGPNKNEKLGTDFSHTQNILIEKTPMSNDVFFYRASGPFNNIQNAFIVFLPELLLHRIFALNCAVVFAADSRDGILLPRPNPDISESYSKQFNTE